MRKGTARGRHVSAKPSPSGEAGRPSRRSGVGSTSSTPPGAVSTRSCFRPDETAWSEKEKRMSEKQTKRKRRAERRRQAQNEQRYDVQETLWDLSSTDPLPAWVERAVQAFEEASSHGSPPPTPARQESPPDFGHLAIALSAPLPLHAWQFY